MIPAGFRRVTRTMRCPICGKPDWCLRSSDSSERTICARVPSAIRWREAGWVHGGRDRAGGLRVVGIEPRSDFQGWARLAWECRLRLHERSEIRGQLSVQLGVSAESLDVLNVGLLMEGVSTWPMRDHLQRVVGIRLRHASGEKRAVRGSRNALFIPQVAERELVVLCEGESDTAAALDLGVFPIGRPGCSNGTDILARWLRRRPGRDLAIMADADEPGIRGAAKLAAALSPLARAVRVLVGPRGWKDLRQAVQCGYTREDLFEDLAAAPLIRANVQVELGRSRR